jgi:hypothetical protein
MLYRISFQFAIITMLIILSLVITFHLLILSQIIPYNIVWGGKFQNVTQMRSFEIASIIINFLMILILAIKGQYMKLNIPIKTMHIVLWLVVILFFLSTVGNLFAKTSTETIVFTPISFISAILCFRIVMEKKLNE